MMRLLGVVDWVNEDNPGFWLAGVRPLVDGDWKAVSPADFPSRGLAFWGGATDARKDVLFYFGTEENPGRTPPKDRFRVVDPKPALEILDYRSSGDADQVRKAVSFGIRRATPVDEVLLWSSGDVLVGPVRLVLGPNGLLTMDRDRSDRIPFCRVSASDVREVRCGRQAMVLAIPLPPPAGYVDWDDDRAVLQRALKTVLARSTTDRLDEEAVRRILDDAARAPLAAIDKTELELDAMRMDRARSIVAASERLGGLSRELVEALQEHPDVQTQIRAAIRTAENEARLEVAQKLAFEREELERLEVGVQRARRDLEATEGDLRRAGERRDNELEETRKLTEAQLQAVLASPSGLAATASIQRAVAGMQPIERVRTRRPVHTSWQLGAALATDTNELRRRAAAAFKAEGFAASHFQHIHAALAGRLVPVLAGADAQRAAEAYARVVTAERIAVVNVGAHAAEPGDMFGRVSPVGHVVPHAAGLCDLLTAAGTSTGYMLVLLEGANRAPPESVLIPLVRAWRLGTSIRVFHPAAIDEDDPYADCASVIWPSNVLLACTLVEGATTLPMPSELWSSAVFVEIQAEEVFEARHASTSEVDPTSDLLSLIDEELDVGDLYDLTQLLPVRATARRFARGLRRFTSDPRVVDAALAHAVAAPALASLAAEDVRDAAAKVAEVVLDADFDAYLARVRSRLS
jgi:hypothetical protein